MVHISNFSSVLATAKLHGLDSGYKDLDSGSGSRKLLASSIRNLDLYGPTKIQRDPSSVMSPVSSSPLLV